MANTFPGQPMQILHGKMKRLKNVLKSFNKDKFGEISSKVADKKNELADVQKNILNSNPSTKLISLEKSLVFELQSLVTAEESFFRQKSRIILI
ncbi:hypothetical protein DITRI_Ditri13aG0077400 [Diplodiscus trichospermus]